MRHFATIFPNMQVRFLKKVGTRVDIAKTSITVTLSKKVNPNEFFMFLSTSHSVSQKHSDIMIQVGHFKDEPNNSNQTNRIQTSEILNA